MKDKIYYKWDEVSDYPEDIITPKYPHLCFRAGGSGKMELMQLALNQMDTDPEISTEVKLGFLRKMMDCQSSMFDDIVFEYMRMN